mgnify:CR=1 FL=1
MTCIITGCALLDTEQERWLWGDLHLVGGVWVFNGCQRSCEAAWTYQHAKQLSPAQHILILRKGDEGVFFERRGVAIIAPTAAYLNPAARDYVMGSPHVPEGVKLIVGGLSNGE